MDDYNEEGCPFSKAASEMPLIHVTPHSDFGRMLVTDCMLRILPPLLRRSQNAPTVESALAYCPPLYFFAGRAYPLGGGVALAFPAGCETGHTGSATPFDSGGMWGGKIHSTLRGDQAAVTNFCKGCTISLDSWRDEFTSFLKLHFASPVGYWMGRPKGPDPHEIFSNEQNTWRAWTWEVRFCEDHDVLGALTWCPSPEKAEEIELELENLAAHNQQLEQFLNRRLKGDGDVEYRRLVEDWARAKCGV